MPRKYTLKKRAQDRALTRQRIVEATVALHAELGPAHTSISAIAKRAGVRRATVYDHFADERQLAEACTSHYLGHNPPPDPAAWRRVGPPAERLHSALAAIYEYHRSTEAMMTSVYRDVALKPELMETRASQEIGNYWESVARELEDQWARDGEAPATVRAAVRHAIQFPTWRSLVREQGLDDVEAVELMAGLVLCAAANPSQSKG